MKRILGWLGMAVALLALIGVNAGSASARGGRRGGGGMPGGGGRGGGRGGAGRGGSRGGGRGGRNSGAGGRSAKEWQLIQEQEERLEMVKERRARLMDLERKEAQEKWLAEKRQAAADSLSHTQDVR